MSVNAAHFVPVTARRGRDPRDDAARTARAAVHIRFAEFELDESNARLLREDAPATITPKAFAVLCALARRPGCLATKHGLLDEVWGHQFVSDSVLKTTISDVRTVLGDHPRAPRFIETVPRRGYRFIATTLPIRPAAAQLHAYPMDRADRQHGDTIDSVTVQDIVANLPQAAFATMEEFRRAHDLLMQLRALLLRSTPAAA